jgi:CRISPR type III-A-associated protein Csm2
MTADEAKQVVADGDMDLLIRKAKDMADALGGSDQSQTQLRRLFGEVRRIDMAWTDERAEAANNRLLMLKPRLRYQVARKQLRAEFVDAIEQAIDQVQKDRSRFKHFADLTEAILAYAKK